MRILMVNQEFPPILGGAANATRYISRELVASGHQVAIVTSRVRGSPEFELLEGVRVFRVAALIKNMDRTSLGELAKFLLLAIAKVNDLCKKDNYDLIHYFFSIPTGLVSFFVNKRYPYIVSLRGSDVPGYDPGAFALLHKLLKPLNIAVWRRAKRVVALSEGLKKIAQVWAPYIKFEVIHNGVDDDLFQAHKKEESQVIRLISVSRLLQRKGIQYLLEAIAQMGSLGEKIRLLIVGTGPFERYLKSQVADLGLKDTVSFYGKCPYEELPRLYNDADIFVLPSLTESFGMVFVEAMACGLPIIASRVGGIPEVVADGKNGILVPAADIEQLKIALTTMINNNELRKKMGIESLRRTKEFFGWDRIANRYMDIYRSVLS